MIGSDRAGAATLANPARLTGGEIEVLRGPSFANLPTAPPASTRQDMNTRASGPVVRANAPTVTEEDR